MSDTRAGGLSPIFREEALVAHRAPREPGRPLGVARSPGLWVMAVLASLMVSLVIAAAIVSSPEYVAGRAVIQFEGVRFARTPGAGAVDEVLVEPGQWVDAGDVLARMDSTRARQALTRAKREYDDAVRAMLRQPGQGAARSAVGTRAQALARARADLRAAEIRAPSSGQVQAVRVRNGQRVADAQVVCTLAAEPGPAKVLAFLPGNARPKLERGAALRLSFDRHPQAKIELEVESISNGSLGPEEVIGLGGSQVGTIEGGSVAVGGSIPLTVHDDRGRPLRVFDGMTAQVEILVRERSLLERMLGGGTR